MAFRIVRCLGYASLSTVLLAALWCRPAVAEDAEVPAQPATIQADESSAGADVLLDDGPNQQPRPTPAKRPETGEATSTEQPRDEPSSPSPEPPSPSPESPLEPIPDPQGYGPVEVEAASFKGVTPGVTTIEEVERAWGPPKEIRKQNGTLQQLYAMEPFRRVEVSYFKDKVASVVVCFHRNFPAASVAKQLELTNVRSVLVSNELGEILGQVYPERGVLFAFAPGKRPGKTSREVDQVILEPITAEPFVLRAQTNLESQSELSLSDLQQVLKLQPGNARAQWLLARLLLAIGELDKALAASAQAVRLEPTDSRYRVTRAKVLGQMGHIDRAIQEAQKAVDISRQRPHVKARALCLLGDLTASGSKPDFKQAIKYHIRALKAADPMATSRYPAVRQAAKEVLVDAHLGAAHDIAWGNWKAKEKAVATWLGRADLFAEEIEGGTGQHRFRVSTRALAACVGVGGKLDPSKWTKEAIRTGEELIARTNDPLRKAQYRWDLGLALYDALQVYQMRNDHETALKYGELAIEHLEKGNPGRHGPTGNYLLGRLYFRLGAIHAIRDGNHRLAVTWFDKAIPRLKKPIPREALGDLAQHGETFISMGVSYWESRQPENAVELTQTGIALMEKAAQQGLIDKSDLALPYSNLASMHRQLDRTDEAERFEEMATKVKRTKLR